MKKTWTGSCVCGAVKFEVSGDPLYRGFCHCVDCRAWLGAPVNAYTIWKYDQVTFIEGADNLLGYAKTEQSIRKRCATCGAAVMSEHPQHECIDVYVARLEGFDHKPHEHVFYSERVIDMPDGIPKFKKLPPDDDATVGDIPET